MDAVLHKNLSVGFRYLFLPRAGLLAWVARILVFSVIVLLASKWLRNHELQQEKIIYIPKYVVRPTGGKADDADLALVWDNLASKQCGYSTPADLLSLPKDFITPYYIWITDQSPAIEPLPNGPRVSSIARLELFAKHIAFKTEKDKSADLGELFASDGSMQLRPFALRDNEEIFRDSMADRFDDGIFLNTLGASLASIPAVWCALTLRRLPKKLSLRVRPKRIWKITAIAFGLLLVHLYTVLPLMKHAQRDHGPIHGAFWCENFRPIVKMTQISDGIQYIVSGGLIAAVLAWQFYQIVFVCAVAGAVKPKSVQSKACRSLLSWFLTGPILGMVVAFPAYGGLLALSAWGWLLSSVATSGFLYFVIINSVLIISFVILMSFRLPKGWRVQFNLWPTLKVGP